MERGRTGAASIVAETHARGAAAAGLSGVARGSEREGGNTAARRDKRPDDAAAACGDATHRRKICADAGSNLGDFRFRGGIAGASRFVQRGRPTSSFGKSLTRATLTPNYSLAPCWVPPPRHFCQRVRNRLKRKELPFRRVQKSRDYPFHKPINRAMFCLP